MADSRVAIITGAGSGIGRATAVHMAGLGWRVTLVGRRAAMLDDTRLLMTKAHKAAGDAIVIAADIAETDAAGQIIHQTAEQFGRVDALVNNAAAFVTGPIKQASDNALRESFEVNAFGPTQLVRHAWPIMARNSGGRIVNVSSMATRDPFPGLGVYGMSKSALEGLTRAINNEGQREGILAFSIVLGAVETDMLRSFVRESVIPTSRTLDPTDVAKVIADCAGGRRDADARMPIVLVR